MTVLAQVRERALASGLASYARSYQNEGTVNVDAEQLYAFNSAWRQSLERSPWARGLRDQFALPNSFRNWPEVAEKLPALDKSILRPLLERVDGKSARVQWRSTGGSSAEPFRFPAFAGEADVAALDIWLGRQWLGIAPSNRNFLIWGHSHTLGSGLKGQWAKMKRTVVDHALGYTRFSAYLLGDDDMRRGGEALLRSGARYIVSYAVALDRFCRANADREAEFRKLKLVAAIATAEGFPCTDSREAIEACLGCPVVMEYGSMETGPVAYEVDKRHYRVFWRHHRLESLSNPESGSNHEILVTCLYPRALPLVRYRIGDLLAPTDGASERTTFARIIGRCNDFVELPDGTSIHSEAITHCVRECPGIRVYQVQTGPPEAAPRLIYDAQTEISEEDLQSVRGKLARIHPELGRIAFERREQLEKTIAGKHRMVIREAR